MSASEAERQRKLEEHLNNICREHERLERDLTSEQYERHQALIGYIDEWEDTAIKRIEKAAAAARKDVKKILQGTRHTLQQTLHNSVTAELRATLREETKLTEFNIDRWLAHLHEIRKRLENLTSSVEFTREKSIQLIKVQQKSAPRTAPVHQLLPFEEIRGEVTFHAAESIIRTNRPAVILSRESYAAGTHYFRFRIEKGTHELFFGVVAADDKSKLKDNKELVDTMYGWWNVDRQVLGGRKQPNVSVLNVLNGDELILILNRRAGEIFLEYPSMSKLNAIKLPDAMRSRAWKVLIEIGKPGECLIRTLDWGKLAHGKNRPERRLHCFCATDPVIPQTRASYRRVTEDAPSAKKESTA